MKTAGTDTRRQILDAAQAVIVGRGFAAVGLAEILAAAKVPKGSFYHYFSSKEQFGGELLARYFDGYLGDVEARLAVPGMSAAARLMSVFERWRETQAGDDMQSRCLMVKLGAEVCDLSEAMRAELEAGTTRMLALLAQCLAEGRAAGEFDAALDPAEGAQLLYQRWLGASLLARVQRRSEPLDAALRGTREWLRSLGAPVPGASGERTAGTA